MAGVKDHFFGDTPYPESPGYKATGTSQEAARTMVNKTDNLRARVLAAIKTSVTGLTADETAERLGETVLAIRPRLSELHTLKKIVDSKVRRTNKSGRRAAVWILTPIPKPGELNR